MKFLIRLVIDALALAAAAWLIGGIWVSGRTDQDKAVTLLVVALIFGLVNAVVRPVVTLLSLPFIILTLGLLLFVINAFMLWLASTISSALGFGFHVSGFWSAVFGALIVTVATWVLELVLPDGD